MIELTSNFYTLAGVISCALCALVVKQFTPPSELQHLPRVPILPLLWSYAKGEVEDIRIKKLIVPFANEKGEGVVVVYALGRWIVHVLDHKVRLLFFPSTFLILTFVLFPDRERLVR